MTTALVLSGGANLGAAQVGMLTALRDSGERPDVLTGLDVLFSDGPAVEAILASTAIPGVLPPVQIDGRSYMDGGVVNNTPISHGIELGADTISVLATGYSCALFHAPRSALGMSLHAVTLMIHQRLSLDVERYADLVDLRVVPPLCPISVPPTDFSQADDLIRRAHRHTSDWLDGPMSGSTRRALPLFGAHSHERRPQSS